MNSVQKAGLSHLVRYLGPRTLEQIVDAIGECNVGVIPNKRSIFTEINTPTRIFEYLSQSKPVIAPSVPGILDYFGPDELFFFKLGDADDLAKAIEQVYRNPELALATVRRGHKVYRFHTWSNERMHFIRVVANTLSVEGSLEMAPQEEGK